MIKVFYSGWGYVSQVNEQGFNKELANATLSKYSGYFLMDSSVIDVLEHFDVTTISRLDFIYDKLPRGITKDLAHGNRFGLASYIANARFGRIYYQFELRKGVRKYGYDHNETFKNALHILDNVQQPATVLSEELPIISKYQERNNDFMAWLESENPPLAKMTKEQIHARLIARNSQLWTSGFYDWWEQQNIYKASRGRKKIQ